VQAGRGAALWLMTQVPPLRRAVMRRALRLPAA
jgi:hypothetical protein